MVRTAAWPGLPPIQRATARPSWPVADSGFGGRLSTWQNPAFTGTLSHAVLDGAPGGLVQGVLTASARPSPGLELPALSLPVAAPGEPGTEQPPAQRAAAPFTVDRPSGPSVTPVPAPAPRSAALTRTAAPAAPVQRRALPVAVGRGRGGSGARPATSPASPAAGGSAPSGTRRRPLLGAPVTAPPPGSAPLTKPAASHDSPSPGTPSGVRAGAEVPRGVEEAGRPGGQDPVIQRAVASVRPASVPREDAGEAAGEQAPAAASPSPAPPVRSLAPARALTPAMPSALSPVAPKFRPAPAAVPLRQTAPAVQRRAARSGGGAPSARRPDASGPSGGPGAEGTGRPGTAPMDGGAGPVAPAAVPSPVPTPPAGPSGMPVASPGAPTVQRAPATPAGPSTGPSGSTRGDSPASAPATVPVTAVQRLARPGSTAPVAPLRRVPPAPVHRGTDAPVSPGATSSSGSSASVAAVGEVPAASGTRRPSAAPTIEAASVQRAGSTDAAPRPGVPATAPSPGTNTPEAAAPTVRRRTGPGTATPTAPLGDTSAVQRRTSPATAAPATPVPASPAATP
ncbi:hypothetical protein ACFUI1_05300, partial [Streptomyces sp. NPDC057238]